MTTSIYFFYRIGLETKQKVKVIHCILIFFEENLTNIFGMVITWGEGQYGAVCGCGLGGTEAGLCEYETDVNCVCSRSRQAWNLASEIRNSSFLKTAALIAVFSEIQNI